MLPEDKIEKVFRLRDHQRSALKKLGLESVRDLLYHFPSKYFEASDRVTAESLSAGQKATLYGTLKNLKTKKAWKSKVPMAEGVFEDQTGKVKVVWFNQPYIAKMIPEGAPVKLVGSVSETKNGLSLNNPEVERVSALPASGASLFGEDGKSTFLSNYPESKGITSRWFYHAVRKVFDSEVLDNMGDPIPSDILKKYNLPTLKSALIWIHNPRQENHHAAARKRFAFEEVFSIQLANQMLRKEYENEPSFEINIDPETISEFENRFPFKPTGAQNRAVADITKDFSEKHAMGRLLHGDVGSGKTYVAAVTSYSVVTTPPAGRKYGNLQVAYMAPTEILANQLYESFIEYFKHMPINIGLITGSGCKKFPSKVDPSGWTKISRSQFLKWVENGEIPIVVGTHALIQKTVKFQNLAYVIIDEQHRFGTRQRKTLARKQGELPHLLSMSATPIPRTLALTIYGDLDLSVLDEKPAGRQEVETVLVPPDNRKETYEKIREELRAGRQAYVICPRIEAPDPEDESALQLRSVEEETERLKKEIFPEFNVESLHGKMTPKKKEEIMKNFEEKKIDILVSTSVVEVGVNVPNATVIVIEGAERFGLAQLHQLRGRVQRSTDKPFCYVFTDTKSKHSLDRLKALQSAKNGFELAELDLSLRGAGELAGGKQWGISDVGMEAIRNIKMVEAARKEAEELIKKDPALKKHARLLEKVSQYRHNLHLE